MAKRYHQSKKDRMDERAGEMRHERDRFNDERRSDRDEKDGHMLRMTSAEMYAGMEPRRRQELEDAGMIHEDHNAIANLPQNVMIKAYPKTGPYLPEGLDDTMEGVDRQMDYDDAKRREHFYPKKV